MQVVKASPFFLRKASTLAVLVVLCLGILAVFLPLQSVKAAAPTYNSKASGGVVSAAVTSGTLAVTASGDLVVITVGEYSSVNNLCATLTAPAPSLSYAVFVALGQINAKSADSCSSAATYYLVTTSTTGFTVTETVTGYVGGSVTYVSVADFSNLPASVLDVESGTCNTDTFCPTNAITAGVTAYGAATGQALYIGGTFPGGTTASVTPSTCANSQSWTVLNAPNVGLAYCFPSGSGTTQYGQNLQNGNGPDVIIGVAFGVPGTGGVIGQTQIIGACPSGATGVFTTHAAGTFAPANNTVYLYSGAMLGGIETVNQIQAAVNSTIGSGPHTLQLLLFTSNSPSVSVASPLLLEAYSLPKFVITSGTTNQIIQWNVGVGLANSISQGNVWAIGLVGDDHIKLATSGVSGITTQSGQASTALQTSAATGYTSLGTPVSTELFFCAQATYQSVLSIVITTTVINIATSTITSVQTVTSNTGGGGTAALGIANYSLMFLLIVCPGFLLGAGIGLYTKSPQGAGIGMMAGFLLGAGIGAQPSVSLVPPALFFAVLVSSLLIMVGIWRLGGSSSA